MSEYFAEVKSLIEETYRINEHKKVILMCHSIGCVRSVNFLNNQTDSWKNEFIHEYVTLASPWAGSTDALMAKLIGEITKSQIEYHSKFIRSQVKILD